LLVHWQYSLTPLTYLGKLLGIDEAHGWDSPLGPAQALLKFVTDKFVTALSPSRNEKYLGYMNQGQSNGTGNVKTGATPLLPTEP